MKSPKLTIIIPMWNSEKFILPCLQSITGYDDLEVIVVDDGSKDDSVSFVKEYFSKQKGNYHVYKRPHKGISLTRRFGIEKSKAPYILFLDSDDQLNVKNCLSLLENMKKNKVDVGMGRVSTGSNKITIPSVNLKWGNRVIDLKSEKHLLSSFLTLLTAKIWKKELLSLYDSKGSANEDVECVPLMLAKANCIYASDQVIYKRVNRRGSTSLTDICNAASSKSLENTVYPLLSLRKRFEKNDLYDFYRQEVDAICMKQFFERIFNIHYSKGLHHKNELSLIVGQLLVKVIPDFKENIHYLDHFKRMEINDRFCYRVACKVLQKIPKTDSSIEELITLYEKTIS